MFQDVSEGETENRNRWLGALLDGVLEVPLIKDVALAGLHDKEHAAREVELRGSVGVEGGEDPGCQSRGAAVFWEVEAAVGNSLV